MSFILDALKKSEIERQRQTVPGLVDLSIARRGSRLPVWAIALCILLGVNLIVLLVVLLRGWMTTSHAPQAQATAHTRRVAPPAADKPFSPLDAPPVYAPEVPVTSADNAAATPTPTVREPAIGLGDAGTHAIRHRDPVLNDKDDKSGPEEVLPSINEINLTGDEALPELHLDVHVFATNPAERFVFINNRKYHEGATLQDGPTVERIRRDGVVLTYRGLRFLLPRQ
jgi:general secretion pathway protein B